MPTRSTSLLVALAFPLGLLLPQAHAQDHANALLWYTFDNPVSANVTPNLGTLGAVHDGELRNDATFTPFGPGQAVQLDGDNDWVIPFGSESAFDIADDDFSIFARIQTSAFDPNCPRLAAIVWKENSGPAPGYALGVNKNTGRCLFILTDGTNAAFAQTGAALNDGLVHEVLAVRSGDQLFLSVDGLLCSTAEIPLAFGSTGNDNALVIGGRTLTGAGCSFAQDDFEGVIDEICVWDEAVQTPFGSQYCAPATSHSGGVPGLIKAFGSNVLADNELRLAAVELPQNEFGYFLASHQQGLIVGPAGSQGTLCLGGTIGRFVAQVQNSGSCGAFSILVDLGAIPVIVPPVAGDTLYFQAWFRDNNPGPTSNFTDGLSITFQ